MSLSVHTIDESKLSEYLENHIPEFNKTEFLKLMINDGIGEVSLRDLYQSFQKMRADYLA